MTTIPGSTDPFDQLKKFTKSGVEFWMARDIQRLLAYATWENFSGAIEKAIISAQTTGLKPSQHFRETTKMLGGGNNAVIKRADFYLSRHACYLIAMNGDPSKEEIAVAQAYFAIQTRRQEIADESDPVRARLEMREKLKSETKGLHSAAKSSGVRKYGLFNDAGNRGLYGGLGLSAIKARKGLSDKDSLYDRAGTSELSAHYFKAEQTKEKLARLKVKGEREAGQIHHQVGAEVRRAIKNNGNIMPEDMPAEISIKKLAKPKALKPPASND